MLPIDALLDELPKTLPPAAIDRVRPRKCSRCHNVAGAGSDLLFHGHGVREVLAVMPGRHWQGRARIVGVAVRRFRCKQCGAVVAVYPPGVLPRHLYSLLAVVAAWWHRVEPPLGGGLDDEAVYVRQGVDRWPQGTEEHRTGRRRWRSLARWAAKVGAWWPGRAVAGSTWRARVASLLAGFAAEAGEAGLSGVMARAVASHVGAGAVM
jgi:hypothetical protein